MSWDSFLARAPDSWLKACGFESWQEHRRIFFSRVNFVCWLLFRVCSTPMLLQWHVKDPGHSAKSAGGRLHLNTHTPLTQRRPLTQQSWSWLTLLLSRHSMGTYQETSSHTTCQGTFSQSSQHPEQLWTDPGLKSGITVCKLISDLKKKRTCGE